MTGGAKVATSHNLQIGNAMYFPSTVHNDRVCMVDDEDIASITEYHPVFGARVEAKVAGKTTVRFMDAERKELYRINLKVDIPE